MDFRLVKRFKSKCNELIDEISNAFISEHEPILPDTLTKHRNRYQCPRCHQPTFFKPYLGLWRCERCNHIALLYEIKKADDVS